MKKQLTIQFYMRNNVLEGLTDLSVNGTVNIFVTLLQ